MLLQGDEGYYSREVEYGGDTFQIREMSDAERDKSDALAEQLLVLQREYKALERQEAAAGTLTDDEYSRMNAVGIESRDVRRQHTDFVLSAGIVGWSDDRECTPELVVKLPPKTKIFLAREITKDSSLGYMEVDFLPGQRTP